MKTEEFIRRLKNLIKDHEDSKFIFFLGAGCSISSGIPGAAKLVKSWIPRLKKVKTGSEDNFESWIKGIYPEYNEENASLFYGKIIEDLFLTSEERQREIERLTEGKDPGFGYAVLAQLMTHKECGRHCNVVLTVNFDDLIADALYLYTQKKPLVISHESLAGFVRITRTRPLVIKLHGDARLEPKNTELETKELAESVRRVLKNLLCETGLIFLGYGGHDQSISEILDELPSDALPWGIYWIGSKIPKGETGVWLKRRDAVWVNHNDFDELMLLMLNEFDLSHPKKDRFDRLMNTYFETFRNLRSRIEARLEKEEIKLLRDAMEKAIEEFGSWWGVVLEAEKYEKKDPEKADIIYQEGLKEFPNDADLFGSYARFLHFNRKDYEKAEEYYKRALEIEPEDATNLCNYASFLREIRKNHDRAEEYYKRALEIEPEDATNLGNYASFLHEVRKNHDRAEEYYKRALEIEPEDATNLGNYALFLEKIRKDYDKAEEYYKRALEIEPKDVHNLGNYAGFLLARGDKKGFSLLEKTMELSRGNPSYKTILLECLFYQYAHFKDEHLQKRSLKEIKHLLQEGIRSPGWNLSDNVKRAVEDGHPHPSFLGRLAKVISEEIDIQELDKFRAWQNT